MLYIYRDAYISSPRHTVTVENDIAALRCQRVSDSELCKTGVELLQNHISFKGKQKPSKTLA